MLRAKTVADPKRSAPPAGQVKTAPVRNAHYQVASVEKADIPNGGRGKSWYRYVIDGGFAPLTGCRRGTHKQIAEYAAQLAADLNARSGLGTPSPWAPRQKK